MSNPSLVREDPPLHLSRFSSTFLFVTQCCLVAFERRFPNPRSSSTAVLIVFESSCSMLVVGPASISLQRLPRDSDVLDVLGRGDRQCIAPFCCRHCTLHTFDCDARTRRFQHVACLGMVQRVPSLAFGTGGCVTTAPGSFSQFHQEKNHIHMFKFFYKEGEKINLKAAFCDLLLACSHH